MKTHFTFKFLIFFFGFFSLVLNAQIEFNLLKLDSLLNVYEQKNKLMLTLSITKKGHLEYSKAIGYSWFDGAQQLKSNSNTKYRIGSITKTFTAVMILQLIEERKLKLTTPLSKFFPKFLNAKQITIEYLLKHRSGIHNFTDDKDYLSYMNNAITHQGLMDTFMKLPSDFDPGLKHEYSNTNYVLLGFIIEKLTKKTYEDALRERITNRIGLMNTYVGSKAEVAKNEARSFHYDGKEWVVDTETDMSVPLGAGAIVSTADDLNKFIEAIFTHQLLKEETVNQMIVQQDGYGMGVFTIPFYEKLAVGHNGRLDNFQSTLAYFQEDSVAVAMSANGINTDLNDFLIGVLSIYFNRPFKIPNFYIFDVPDETLKEYAGTYHCAMLKMDFYILNEGHIITGQAPEQPEFPLEAKSESIFQYDPAGVIIEFGRNQENEVDQFILKQSGMEFVFKKLK